MLDAVPRQHHHNADVPLQDFRRDDGDIQGELVFHFVSTVFALRVDKENVSIDFMVPSRSW